MKLRALAEDSAEWEWDFEQESKATKGNLEKLPDISGSFFMTNFSAIFQVDQLKF